MIFSILILTVFSSSGNSGSACNDFRSEMKSWLGEFEQHQRQQRGDVSLQLRTTDLIRLDKEDREFDFFRNKSKQRHGNESLRREEMRQLEKRRQKIANWFQGIGESDDESSGSEASFFEI